MKKIKNIHILKINYLNVTLHEWRLNSNQKKTNQVSYVKIFSLFHTHFLSKVHVRELNNLPTQKKYIFTVRMILINNRWITKQRRYIKLQRMHKNTAYILAQRSTLILCAVSSWQHWWQKMQLIWQFPWQTVQVPYFF